MLSFPVLLLQKSSLAPTTCPAIQFNSNTDYLEPVSDFPRNLDRGHLSGGPVVKSLPWDAGDSSLILGQGTKTPHAEGQLDLHATTSEPACHN